MTLLLHEYSPITVPEEFQPVFDEGPHTYHWRNWLMPGVSHLLEETGIRKPFDRGPWRNSLIKKHGVPEEHVDAEMDKAAIRGTEAHLSIGFRMMQQDLQLDRNLPEPDWGEPAITQDQLRFYVMRSEMVLKELEVSEVLMVEQTLVHPVGHYCGTIDLLAKTPEGLIALDWKTKASGKPLTNDKTHVFQLAAYLGAINNIFKDQTTEDGEPIRVLRAANALLSPDDHRLFVYERDEVINAWIEFQGLLHEYWELRVNQGEDYHSPDMAQAAFANICEHWGPFVAVES